MSEPSNGRRRQRLFFALWPDDAVRRRLAGIAKNAPARAGRLVPAENLHLTLVFLGSVDPGARDYMEAAADGITAGTFELVFTHLGCWPRARVLWAGAEETPEALVELVSTLRGAMTGCGLRGETRPYRVHVTLARNSRARGSFRSDFEPLRWRVDAFHLLESQTLASGARYRTLKSWPLGR